jgi:MFS family permease
MTSLAAADAPAAETRVSRRAERLLLPATFITNLGNSIQLTAASIVMLQSEHSTVAVGWLFVAFSVPATLLSLLFGPLVDRFDRRTLCLLCDLVSALVAAALPVWLLSGGAPNVGIYAVTFLLAAVGALFMPASNALIKERVADRRLGPFNANFEIATQAGTLLSTAIGGVLVQFYGAAPLFFFNAATFVASMACFGLMGRRIGRSDVTGAPLPVGAAPARAPLARLGLLYALGQPIVVVVNTLIVVLLLQTYNQKAGVLGVADSLAGVGAIAAATLYKWLSPRLPNLRIALGGYVLCGTLLALETHFGVWVFMALYPLGAMMFGTGRVAARTMLLHAVPENRAGRVFGTVNAFGLMVSVAATLAISRLVDHSTVQIGWTVLGTAVACTAVAAVALLWPTHGRPAPDPTLDPPAPVPAA